jgi:hypothetical protein
MEAMCSCETSFVTEQNTLLLCLFSFFTKCAKRTHNGEVVT